MQVGVHLPQFGRASGPDAISSAARLTEQLGFADCWVSDHVVQPADQGYPSPYLYDPLLTLGWAAAATRDIRLGTSVMVAPQHPPLWLANAVASLDALSGGRVLLGVGVGWSEAEYEALGQDFTTRGRRLDEIIPLLRACWSEDPVSFSGDFYSFANLRVLPKPAHSVGIWVGGGTEAAYRRAVDLGDGFQLIGVTPEEAAPVIARLRADRPEPEFTISLRTGWDPQGMDPGRIRDERVAYADVGVDHVVAAPWRTDLAAWLRSIELLADLV